MKIRMYFEDTKKFEKIKVKFDKRGAWQTVVATRKMPSGRKVEQTIAILHTDGSLSLIENSIIKVNKK